MQDSGDQLFYREYDLFSRFESVDANIFVGYYFPFSNNSAIEWSNEGYDRNWDYDQISGYADNFNHLLSSHNFYHTLAGMLELVNTSISAVKHVYICQREDI